MKNQTKCENSTEESVRNAKARLEEAKEKLIEKAESDCSARDAVRVRVLEHLKRRKEISDTEIPVSGVHEYRDERDRPDKYKNGEVFKDSDIWEDVKEFVDAFEVDPLVVLNNTAEGDVTKKYNEFGVKPEDWNLKSPDYDVFVHDLIDYCGPWFLLKARDNKGVISLQCVFRYNETEKMYEGFRDEDELNGIMNRFLGKIVPSSIAKECFKQLKASKDIPVRWEKHGGRDPFVFFRNGRLNRTTFKFEEVFKPEDLNTYRLNYEYPNRPEDIERCVKAYQRFTQPYDPTLVQTMEEALGYGLVHKENLKRMYNLSGDADSGKSGWLKLADQVCTTTHGNSFRGTMRFEELGSERFDMQDNMDDWITCQDEGTNGDKNSGNMAKATAKIKERAAGGTFKVKVRNVGGVNYDCTSVDFIATNIRLIWDDSRSAMTTRLVVIAFTKKSELNPTGRFDMEKRDPGIGSMLNGGTWDKDVAAGAAFCWVKAYEEMMGEERKGEHSLQECDLIEKEKTMKQARPLEQTLKDMDAQGWLYGRPKQAIKFKVEGGGYTDAIGNSGGKINLKWETYEEALGGLGYYFASQSNGRDRRLSLQEGFKVSGFCVKGDPDKDKEAVCRYFCGKGETCHEQLKSDSWKKKLEEHHKPSDAESLFDKFCDPKTCGNIEAWARDNKERYIQQEEDQEEPECISHIADTLCYKLSLSLEACEQIIDMSRLSEDYKRKAKVRCNEMINVDPEPFS